MILVQNSEGRQKILVKMMYKLYADDVNYKMVYNKLSIIDDL